MPIKPVGKCLVTQLDTEYNKALLRDLKMVRRFSFVVFAATHEISLGERTTDEGRPPGKYGIIGTMDMGNGLNKQGMGFFLFINYSNKAVIREGFAHRCTRQRNTQKESKAESSFSIFATFCTLLFVISTSELNNWAVCTLILQALGGSFWF